MVSKTECASALHYKRSLRVTALRGDQQRAQQSGSAYTNVNPHVLWQSVLYTCILVRKIIQLSVRRWDMSFNNVNKDKGLRCWFFQGQIMGVVSSMYWCRFFASQENPEWRNQQEKMEIETLPEKNTPQNKNKKKKKEKIFPNKEQKNKPHLKNRASYIWTTPTAEGEGRNNTYLPTCGHSDYGIVRLASAC